MVLVFVYGSLLSNLSNHHFLSDNNPKFHGNYKTVEPYFLTARTDLSYPYLTFSRLTESQIPQLISGELYEVSEIGLAALDMLEEYPFYYDRIEIGVRNSSGSRFEALVYTLVDEDTRRMISQNFGESFEAVSDGNWRNYLKLKEGN